MNPFRRFLNWLEGIEPPVVHAPEGVRLPAVSPRRIRHTARGSVYDVVGFAKLQSSGWPPSENDTLVIYRGPDGRLWAREYDETFEHGRFEVVD